MKPSIMDIISKDCNSKFQFTDYSKALMSLEKITKDIDRTNVKDSEEHEMLYQVMSLMKHRLFKDVVDIQEDYSRVSFY